MVCAASSGTDYLLIFEYVPIYGVQIAFKNYRPSKGIWGSEWVGFDYFIRFINYPEFWKMIKNTLSITLLSLATFPAPIIFALFLNEIRNVKFKKVCTDDHVHAAFLITGCSMFAGYTVPGQNHRSYQ